MQYYIIKLEYSQTEHEYCIFKAKSKDEALKMNKSNARYVSIIGVTDKIIEG
jgi:uncharacterized lipoprotein YehR (DUF1307 family)